MLFASDKVNKEKDLGANKRDVPCSTLSCLTLDRAAIGDTLAVSRVEAPEQSPEWGRWLEEIGFVVGEPVRLMARAIPGGDPMVVRVGQSTFALRRVEAACISVKPIEAFAASSLDQVVLEAA